MAAQQKTSQAPDARLAQQSGGADSRASRESADAQRVTLDGTAMSMDERRAMLREQLNQEVLPTPPQDDKMHYCWLSTTNNADPIYKRMRLGYEPVKAAELPGFSTQHQINGGEFDGCIACNEMILFKLPRELYEEIMLINHHEKPMEEEQMIRDNATDKKTDTKGKTLVETEGFERLGRKVPKPTFP